MGRFNGIKYSGALKTNSRDFKRLKVRRSIDLMELEDRGTIAEGKSDLPTRGAAHRRHRDGGRRGARGATVNTVDLGYVSGIGSNVVDNQDFGLISETALIYNQTINQQRFGSLDEVTTDSVNTPVWNPNANTTTFVVTVGPKTGGGNAFYLDSGSGPVEAPAITLDYGQNYIFDVSDSSNSGHPFAFTIDDGVSEYARGIARIGSPGQDKAKVRITIPNGNAISGMTNFKYYCTVHGTGMGNTINLAQFIPTYTITPAANNVDEGSTLDFTVSTNDNISVLYWNVVGYTAPVFSTPDINGGSGSFAINQNGTGFFSTGTMLEDSTTEGAETFAIEFRTGSSSGPVVATSDLITINDTSTDSSTGSTGGGGSSTPTPTVVSGSNETSLHITTDGAAGVNNSFADSSSNAYTITANGDPQLNTFSPYRSGGYSTYFDGGGDYLDTNTNLHGNFGTGDFTVEAWVYLDETITSTRAIFGSGTSDSNDEFSLLLLSSGVLYFDWGDVSTQYIQQTGATFTANTWHHIAVTRSGTQLDVWLDGVSAVSNSSHSFNYSGASSFKVGMARNGSFVWKGYMEDVRVVSGTAVYTSDFTPPTERLTAITGTELLTCHLPYITDGSTNNHTITVNGNTITKPFSPYDRVGYSEDLHGGSIHVDGTGDYVTSPITAIGTGDFTAECWVYPTAFGQYGGVFSSSAIGAPTGISVSVDKWWLGSDTGFTAFVTGNKFTLNTWQHVAVVRNGTTVTGYVNGVSVGTAELATNLTSTAIALGSRYQNNGDYLMTGNISDFRLVNSAVYTSAFTPPTAPLESTGTELHIKGVEGHIIDKSQSGNNFTLVGDVTASTAESKYAGSSIYFDGGGDYIKLDGTFSEFFDNAWTIEFWAYLNSLLTSNAISIGDGGGVDGMYLLHGGGGFYLGSNGSWNISTHSSPTITTNQWHHCAVTWDGSTYRIFVDGNLEYSAASTAKLGPGPYTMAIGATYNGGQPTDGYIEDLRLTQGVARYTESFTPPTESLATYSTTGGGTSQEETIPQVTALQGSMTIGDTATLSATGVSKFTPTENFTANVKMWGAAGGNGTNSFGGRGGYTEGTYEFQAGTTYQILVGQGGKSNNANTGGVDTRTGGGGRVGVTANSGDFRATGGGYTGLFDTTILQSNALLIAGGGGGGGPTGYPGTDANAGGGDGGGTSGTNGSNGGYGGGGQAGTQLAGGDKGYDAGSYAGTNEAGSALLGGGAMSTITENYSGSGGGGGYFGGGGGGSNNYAGGAGGGGSSYIHTSITNGQTISGVDIDNKTGTVRGTVPGSTETEWNGTAGSQAATKAKEGESPDGQITITVIDPNAHGGSALSNQGDRGVFGGGRGETFTVTSTIQYFDISTAGDASSFGNLTVSRRQMAAFSSGSRGVFAGGLGPSTTQTTIDYITIASLGAATDFGDMTTLKGDTCGLSDQTRGIIGPSWTPQVAATDVIDYVTIATPSNSSDFGDMTVATFGTAAAADATRGLIAGGYSNSRTNTIEYITIQTIGNATDFGDLTAARYQLQGLSDDTYAVFAGGDTSTTISDTIDYVTVATTGQAASFGILTVSRERMGSTGSSNGTYGVFGGGGPTSATYTNTMDYVTISTPGNAVDFGDHITAVRENPGFSGSPS